MYIVFIVQAFEYFILSIACNSPEGILNCTICGQMKKYQVTIISLYSSGEKITILSPVADHLLLPSPTSSGSHRSSSPNLFTYSMLSKPQLHLGTPRNLWATPVRKESRLNADLHLSLISSKTNPWVLTPCYSKSSALASLPHCPHLEWITRSTSLTYTNYLISSSKTNKHFLEIQDLSCQRSLILSPSLKPNYPVSSLCL